jgi:hypothetical protein
MSELAGASDAAAVGSGGGVKVVGLPVDNPVELVGASVSVSDVGENVGISDCDSLGASLSMLVGAIVGVSVTTPVGVDVGVSVELVGLIVGIALGIEEFVGLGVIDGPSEMDGG